MRKGYYTGYRERGCSIPSFIACCFFALPCLFVLSSFFSVLFPSFFCFCYSLAAKRYFSGKIAILARTLYPPSLFFLLKTPSLFFFGTESDFFFRPLFPSFLFFLALLSIYKYYVGYLFLFFFRVRKNRRRFGPGFFFSGSNFSISAKIWGFSANYFLTFLSPPKTHLSQKYKIPSVIFSCKTQVLDR